MASGHDKGDFFATVRGSQDVTADASWHIFVSHAGQQKEAVVDHIQSWFQERHPHLNVFVDNQSLVPGDHVARIWEACKGSTVGVLILSKEFVLKKWCMAELHVLLKRWRKSKNNGRVGGPLTGLPGLPGPGDVHLLPVLYHNLTVDDLKKVKQRLYDSDAPWQEVNEKRPAAAVLDIWARDLETLVRNIHIRGGGAAKLVKDVGEGAVDLLDKAGRFTKPVHCVDMTRCISSQEKHKVVGRERDLQTALAALTAPAQRCVEIRAGPGEGKTTLAKHLVEEVCKQWGRLPKGSEDGTVYAIKVDLEPKRSPKLDGSLDVDDLKNAFAFYVLNQVPACGTGCEHSGWGALTGWLSLRSVVRVLLLLENVEAMIEHKDDSAGKLQQVLTSLHCSHSKVHLLLATRVPLPSIVSSPGRHHKVVELQPLSVEQGMELVEAYQVAAWKDDDERKAAEQEVRRAQCNPLVLTVAAKIVNAQGSKQRWKDLKRQEIAAIGGTGQNVIDNVNMLREWLSKLPPGMSAFLATLTGFVGTFTAEGAAAVSSMSVAQTYSLLQKLEACSLVYRQVAPRIRGRAADTDQRLAPLTHQHAPERFYMHALVREAAKPVPGTCPQPNAAWASFSSMLKSGSNCSKEACRPPSAEEVNMAVAQWLLQDERGPGRALLRCPPGGLQPNEWCVGLLQEELCNLGASIAWVRASCPEGPLAEAAKAVHMRLVHWLDVKQLKEEVVEASRAVLGPKHRGTRDALLNLAAWLRSNGDVSRAQQLEVEVALECDAVPQSDRSAGLGFVADLAASLRWGNVAQALPALQAPRVQLPRPVKKNVVAVAKLVLGEEHPITLARKSSLARTLVEAGKLEEARDLQAEVVKGYGQALPAGHPDMLASKRALVKTLLGLEEPEEARRLQAEVLEALEAAPETQLRDVVMAKGQLASTLCQLGKLAEARQLQVEALEVSVRALGPDSPCTLTSKANLALTLVELGEVAEARKMLEQVLEMRTEVLGAEHARTLTTRCQLAGVLFEMGELREALRLQQEVVDVGKRALGPEHEATLRAKYDLAVTLLELGEGQQALETQPWEIDRARVLLEEVVAARRRLLGAQHPRTLYTEQDLAAAYRVLGRLKEAQSLLEENWKLLMQALGAAHRATLRGKHQMALVLAAAGEVETAGWLLTAVVEGLRDALRPGHPAAVKAEEDLKALQRHLPPANRKGWRRC